MYSLKKCSSTLLTNPTEVPVVENLKALLTISSTILVRCLDEILAIASSKSSSKSIFLFSFVAQL